MDDGNVLISEVLREILAGDTPLLIVTAANAVNVGASAIVSEGGAGGGWRDLHRVALGIDLRCRDRRAGAIMSGNEHHIAPGHLIGDGHRLLRIAGIVADREVELLAEHSARSVDVFDGQFATVLHLGAKRGILTRNWADHGDRYPIGVFLAAAACKRNGGGKSHDQPGNTLHCHLCSKTTPNLHHFPI